MKTLDQRHWLHAGVSIVDFEQVNAGWELAQIKGYIYFSTSMDFRNSDLTLQFVILIHFL